MTEHRRVPRAVRGSSLDMLSESAGNNAVPDKLHLLPESDFVVLYQSLLLVSGETSGTPAWRVTQLIRRPATVGIEPSISARFI